MIQFKEKSTKQGDNVSIGLMDYPVLMAADILLYDADLVPVGEDQKQHLELARDIAQQRINARFGGEGNDILKVPQPLIIKEGAKIMSLADGNKKMSKSDPNENSRITLLDSSELIIKKIKRAKTDAVLGLEFDNIQRPEAHNLLSLYSILSGQTREAAAKECATIGWGTFKPLLAEATISTLKPIQTQYKELMNDRSELERVLDEGREKAEEVAQTTLTKIQSALGMLRRKN
jgi:tryptophanyl-tRNA synthetase